MQYPGPRYPSPHSKTNGASIQGIKRSRADETSQVANKATRVGSTTNGNGTKSSRQVDGNSQPANSDQGRRVPPSQNIRPGLPTGLVPGTDYGRVQTNGQSLVPPLNNNPGQFPTLNNNSEPVSTYPSLQAPSGVQNVQSDSPQFGLHQSGSRQVGSHTQNVMHNNTPGSTNPIQAPPYNNTTNVADTIHQSDPNPQFAAQAGPQPQPASQFPLVHDVRSLIHISESIAKLSDTKVLELLARAAMWHPDVLSEIEIALSYQRSAELQSSSGLLEHMVAQSLRDYQRMRMGPPAQGIQYSQPRCSHAQYPPPFFQAQDLPQQQFPPQHMPPQDPQPGFGRDIHQGRE